MHESFFIFNQKYCTQCDGVAMGSHWDPHWPMSLQENGIGIVIRDERMIFV